MTKNYSHFRDLAYILALIGLITVSASLVVYRDEAKTLGHRPNGPEKSIGLKTQPAEVKDLGENISIPQYIRIPKIKVSTYIQSVSESDNGAMAAPNSNRNAGWYKLGFKPGDAGNAVIAGHKDSQFPSLRSGVFRDLNKLEPGDIVYVSDINDQELKFKVTHSKTYKNEDVPMNAIYGPNNKARLNLVTCAGRWNFKDGYSERLIVYTELDTN